MQPTKRRKLDHIQPFQNKPFRSPLHAPQPQPHILGSSSIATAELSAIAPDARDHLDVLRIPGSPEHNVSAQPEYDNLLKEHSALSSRLSQLRQSLEIAEHALQIEASGQETELSRLITKWRAVAQQAADELFPDAKVKTDEMGGVAAWRRSAEKESRQWHGDVNQDMRAATKELNHPHDAEDHPDLMQRTCTGQRLSEPEPEDEESSFTMETMLHEMRIDLRVIGFDRQLEAWVD